MRRLSPALVLAGWTSTMAAAYTHLLAGRATLSVLGPEEPEGESGLRFVAETARVCHR